MTILRLMSLPSGNTSNSLTINKFHKLSPPNSLRLLFVSFFFYLVLLSLDHLFLSPLTPSFVLVRPRVSPLGLGLGHRLRDRRGRYAVAPPSILGCRMIHDEEHEGAVIDVDRKRALFVLIAPSYDVGGHEAFPSAEAAQRRRPIAAKRYREPSRPKPAQPNHPGL